VNASANDAVYPPPPPDPYVDASPSIGLPPAVPPPSPPLPASPPPPSAPPRFHGWLSPWCASPTIGASAFLIRHAAHPLGEEPPWEQILLHGGEAEFNTSVMLPFGVTPTDRPLAPGRPRRCLSQDDLDGINWLYPHCEGPGVFRGLENPPECVGEETWPYIWQRLLFGMTKLSLMMIGSLVAIKLVAFLFIQIEECIANRYVDRKAKALLRFGPSALNESIGMLSMAFRAKKNERMLETRMAIKLQAGARRLLAMRKVERRRRRPWEDVGTRMGAVLRLQAAVRGRAIRAEIGQPGSRKARLFAMRTQLSKLNQRPAQFTASSCALIPFGSPLGVLPNRNPRMGASIGVSSTDASRRGGPPPLALLGPAHGPAAARTGRAPPPPTASLAGGARGTPAAVWPRSYKTE
jgi:hypothetical protein